MQRTRSQPLAPEVAAARERVDLWRASRRRGTPMPEELWTTAVSLAEQRGAYRISHDVGVSYETLRSRMERAAAVNTVPAAEPAGFVEVHGAELLEDNGSVGAIVELSDADGARLTVRLGGHETVDVLGLAAAFWGRGR